MTSTKVLICPYCGETQKASDRCRACGGLFEALSRQATHNSMGPWFIRNPETPFQPGCSYETLVRLIERGRVGKTSIVRGPTTRQFWTVARRVPGLSHLFGYCHHCEKRVDPEDHGCPSCGAAFGAYLDRDYLGLPEIRPLPWEADHHDEARAAALGRPLGLGGSGGPSGLSSFATDEELRGEGHATARAVLHADTGAAPIGRGSAAAAPATASAPGGTRALQRRLEAQKRRTKILAILLGAAAVVIALMFVPLLMGERSTAAGGAAGPPAPDVAPARNDVAVPPAAPPLPADDEPAAASADGADAAAAPGADDAAQRDPDDTAAPADAAPTPPADPDPVATAMAEATALVERGGDASVPRTERIAAYEQAVALLGRLAPSADGPRRALLDAQRERCELAAERLRLAAFYP